MGEKMRGWEVFEYGGIDALHLNDSINLPVIRSSTEVLVEVNSTCVNPIDQMMLDGYGARSLNVLRRFDGIAEFPLILGCEFCGIVKAKGDKVRTEIQIGDKVWGVKMPHKRGSHAEYVVVDQKTITHKPQNIDDNEAAGVLYAGLTAWSSLYISGGLRTDHGVGKRICILGASGGVGTLAIQMAKAAKMEITATCSMDCIEMVKNLGADCVIDYRNENVAEKVRGQFFDIILDAAGFEPNYATKLPWKFRRYITLRPPILPYTDSSGLIIGMIRTAFSFIKSNILTIIHCCGFLKYGFFRLDPRGIEYFKKLIESGQIKPVNDSIFDFNDIKEAYQKVAKGHLRGKVIVRVKVVE